MVWEQGIVVIVNLTKLSDMGLVSFYVLSLIHFLSSSAEKEGVWYLKLVKHNDLVMKFISYNLTELQYI